MRCAYSLLCIAVLAPSALVAQAATDRTARVERAELAMRRGDRAAAEREASAIVADYQRNGNGWSARDLVVAGRAYLLVSTSDAGAVRSALRAFDAAAAADSSLDEAVLRASDLLLDKYNAPDAKQGYDVVLRRRPGNAWATLGIARVMEFAGQGDALAKAREAVAADARLVPAHLLIARQHLEAERNDSARAAARRALAVDAQSLDAWAVIGAVAWIEGDSAAFRDARAQAERVAPRPAPFFVTLSEAASRQRRYADAERFAARALELDSLSVLALGALGTNRLRTGQIAAGRAHIERAFAIDPFNLWHKNTLDLLDVLVGFRTVRLGRFEFVAPARESDILLPYLSPLLEEAYDKLAARYDYRPEAPVRMEIYARHADFSVRTVGLTGLGALGVSFGRLLAIDAPSARDPETFNWGSTAWHELAHTFTLGLSENRVPRWFSEGVSVLEERRARDGWGARANPVYLGALKANFLRPVSQLNDGFVRPRNPHEVVLSYYHASLVAEMIEAEFGAPALGGMLRGWRDGLTNAQVFQRVLRLDEPALDKRFDTWVRAKFARELSAARAAVPDDSVVADDADLAPLRAEADRLHRAGNDTALVATLERMLWIWPYDPATHVRLAEAASRAGMPGKAVRERRAIIALGPSDHLAARVELARALMGAGDRTGARREVLAVLEQAPTYERAQQLLLELRQPPPGTRP
jgi:cellulose synthase operon protein C